MNKFDFIKKPSTIFFAIFFIWSLVFGIKTLLDIFYFENLAQYSSYLSSLTKIIQNLIFFLLITNLFKKFSFKDFFYILPISFLEQDFNIFSNKIHFFLLESNIYSFFTNKPQEVSPEYPRVIFFLIVLFISFILLFIKKHRSFFRIIIFTSSLAIIGTAILFHTIIIAQINYFSKQQKEYMIQISQTQSAELAQSLCQTLQYECYITPSLKETERLFNLNKIPDFIKETQFKYIIPYYIKHDSYFYYAIASNPHETNRLLGRIPFSVIKNNNFGAIILDRIAFNNYLIFNQMIFAILALTSHLVWFLGGFYLIYYHQKKWSLKAPH